MDYADKSRNTRRSIRNPDRFTSPTVAAKGLRDLADKIENSTEWVAFSITITFAAEEEVRAAVERVAKKQGGAK